MSLKLTLILTSLLLGLQTTSEAFATEQIPVSLEKAVRAAKLSFAGTVDSIHYRRAEQGLVVTDVHFTRVRFAKGPKSDESLVLTVSGGRMGDRAGGVMGAPVFELGKRYVVLAADHGTAEGWYLPVVGLNQGFFKLVEDSRTHRPVIHDWEGRPALRIRDDHLVVLAPGAPAAGVRRDVRIHAIPGLGVGNRRIAFELCPPELDTGSRVSEAEFLETIARLGAE